VFNEDELYDLGLSEMIFGSVAAAASILVCLAVLPLIRGLLEKYPTFGREKETGLLGTLDT